MIVGFCWIAVSVLLAFLGKAISNWLKGEECQHSTES